MSAATAGAVPVAGPPVPNPARDTGDDLRLARLHLRLGMIGMARAELEDLDHRGDLDRGGQAALAEARWRNGELDAAAAMATHHLEAGGTALVALVIAAEAAAAAGDAIEARRLMERAARTDVSAIDTIFGGLPRRAAWPASTLPEMAESAIGRSAGAGAGPGTILGGAPTPDPGAPGTTAGGPATIGGREPPATPIRASAVPTPADVLRANAALWEAAQAAPPGANLPTTTPPPAGGRGSTQSRVEPARQKGHADPERELEAARGELGDDPERGLLRLSLVLRLDPTLAPDVFDAIRLRREAQAAIVRGDAERLMGRHLEAEADYGAAMELIEREALASRHRGGPEAPIDAESETQPTAEPGPDPGPGPVPTPEAEANPQEDS